jgi:hypothetical protein
MEYDRWEALSILTRSDRDRLDAAVALLRQVIEDLVQARMVRVPLSPISPGALYELSEEAERTQDERRQIEMDF